MASNLLIFEMLLPVHALSSKISSLRSDGVLPSENDCDCNDEILVERRSRI